MESKLIVAARSWSSWSAIDEVSVVGFRRSQGDCAHEYIMNIFNKLEVSVIYIWLRYNN